MDQDKCNKVKEYTFDMYFLGSIIELMKYL